MTFLILGVLQFLRHVIYLLGTNQSLRWLSTVIISEYLEELFAFFAFFTVYKVRKSHLMRADLLSNILPRVPGMQVPRRAKLVIMCRIAIGQRKSPIE